MNYFQIWIAFLSHIGLKCQIKKVGLQEESISPVLVISVQVVWINGLGFNFNEVTSFLFCGIYPYGQTNDHTENQLHK